MIDQQTIDKVQDTAQIYDVVAEFVSLRRRGQNYVGLCPFHADKNPSFYVSPAKNVCKCFSCGEGGGPVQFIMKHESMTFYEAIKWLGNKYGIEVEDKRMTDEERARQTVRESMLMVNEFAQRTFEEDLFGTNEGQTVGLTYFRERGLQDETIRRFHLGYALDSRYDFANRALSKGYKRTLLLDPSETNRDGVGLCYGDDPKKTPTCRFYGRVIFPYHSLSGKPVAFGGRILQRVDHAFKKYVNSPESQLYHKSDLLYGIYQAKGEIAKQNKCYIVEGNVDVLTMSQAGFTNVVASAGTALTTNQIRIIKRFTNNVTLMYDGDQPGVAAALKTIDLLLLEGMNVQLILFPNGDDPDSFCRKHSSEEIRRYFEEHEQDFVNFKANVMLQGAAKKDPIRRAQITQNIVQSIALISDPIYFSLFVREASQLLNVSEQAIMKAVEQTKANNYAAEVRKFEIEQRRRMAQQEREERDAEGATAKQEDAEIKQDVSAENAAAVANAVNVEATAEEPVQKDTPAVVQEASTREPLLSDRYELNIVRNLVRHAGRFFELKWQDENNQVQMEVWRVVDYILWVLEQDQIEFKHPLYAKMLGVAINLAAENPVTGPVTKIKIKVKKNDGKEEEEEVYPVSFDSVKIFTANPDPEVSKLALALESDRYVALGIVENKEEKALDYLIPRCVQELQECIVRMEIEQCKKELKHPEPDTDIMQIMTRLNELYAIKKEIDMVLGERIVNV